MKNDEKLDSSTDVLTERILQLLADTPGGLPHEIGQQVVGAGVYGHHWHATDQEMHLMAERLIQVCNQLTIGELLESISEEHLGDRQATLNELMRIADVGVELFLTAIAHRDVTPEVLGYAREQWGSLVDVARQMCGLDPNLTERQKQVVMALGAQKQTADIDPTKVEGLADDELARQLGISEEELRHDLQVLTDLGFIDSRPAVSPADDSRFGQVQCDWQTPDGSYCNMTVHFYALYEECNGRASLAGYCSLEHANASPRPTLAAAQQLRGEMVEGLYTCECCDADFNAKLLRKLIDAYPNPIAVDDAS